MSAISTAEVAGFSDPMAYIFLGDYVDRGRRSLECVCLVLTLKILFPRKYQILRGNHECKGINRVYGFYDELLDRFEKEEAERLWLGFNEVFAWMPLAGLVGKKILCMHGGISAYLNSLDDIRRIARPLEEPNVNPLAMDLLWADPMLNIQGYAPNTVRGVATFFGEDAVVHCCQKLKIDLIVRAHQNNKGAVVYVDKQGKIGFKVLSPLDQPPYVLTKEMCDNWILTERILLSTIPQGETRPVDDIYSLAVSRFTSYMLLVLH
ncbi:hypothetical protein KIN20_019622 [Parelaphostrongylus tenuis]|uniref:Serine/threonine-protein phosphatase n=1 Tax=Parelaphostrongylus tenuis TaxID=148309 RepID=A0AAD5N515_PARTN|nr:hypothetical protein KIN20_019622 [Parelaphostrongylus tenuis]